jgi:hypothetical protein
MSADDTDRTERTEGSGYSDEPDQTNPKNQTTGSDDRDDDAEERAADDEDADEARAEVEDIGKQVGLDDESVTTDESVSTDESSADDGLSDFEDFEADDSDGDDSEEGGATGAGGGVSADTASSGATDTSAGDSEASGGFDGIDQEDPPEGEPPSRPTELGSTDPEDVEQEFGLDLSDTQLADEYQGGGDAQFVVLSNSQRNKLREYITETHGKETQETLNDLISEWKGKAKGQDAAHLEAIGREALGVDAPIRTPDGESEDTFDFPDPTDEEVAAYRDLARVSQAFIKEHYADEDGKVGLRRGIPTSRQEATADLTEQIFDNPDRDTYLLRTSVMSNHTVLEDTADYFEDAYSVSYRTDVSNIGLMPMLTRNTLAEAEMHVVGGGARVPEDGVGSSNYDQDFADLADAVQNPAEADYDAHETLKRGLKAMQRETTFLRESTAKTLARYAHRTSDSDVTQSTVHYKAQNLFTDPVSPLSEYRDLYESYDPETDSFDE